MKKNNNSGLEINPTHFLVFIDRLRLANFKRKQFLEKAKSLFESDSMSNEDLQELCKLLDEHTTTEGVDHSVFTPEFLAFVFAPIA